MTLITRLSDRVRALCRTMFGDNEVAQILDRAKGAFFDDETHPPAYFSTITTNEGDADIEIGSTGSIASVVLDSASTTHGVAFFVTSTLTSLNMTGTTGNVYMNVSDNLADAFSIRIASGNRFITFDSTNTNEKVIIAPVAGQKVGFFGATPVVQAATIADPSGGATQDAEARTAINAILVVLENLGFTATS